MQSSFYKIDCCHDYNILDSKHKKGNWVTDKNMVTVYIHDHIFKNTKSLSIHVNIVSYLKKNSKIIFLKPTVISLTGIIPYFKVKISPIGCIVLIRKLK